MRLDRMAIKNFTAFSHAELVFSRGLNVLVGENGTGKTLLMRLPYAVMRLLVDMGREQKAPARTELQRRIAEKLVAVVRSESLGRLARRVQGRQRCEVSLSLRPKTQSIAFSFATQSKFVKLERLPAAPRTGSRPIYLPPRELLTIYPGFLALYDTYDTEFDETWRDTCQLLGAPLRRGPRGGEVADLLDMLEVAMGGRLERDRTSDRFYLREERTGRMEAPLMAEGTRKLAMLAQLAATGALARGTCVFWDEPEVNLNPALIRRVARVILDLCSRGVQIFLATHSLFLLRELEHLCATSHADVRHRYFALGKEKDGVAVQQADDLADVDPLVLLDEDLEQSDRYLAP